MPNITDIRSTYSGTLAFLPSRDELPVLLNERGLFGCGVEVGVQEALFSEHILTHWHGAHLVSVDPWRADEAATYVDIANVPQEEHDRRFECTLTRLAPFGSRSTVWRMTSLEASEHILHHALDFVYLDARHDFDSVMEDLEAWFDKVRPGGIIAGHDYLDGHFPAGVFGVRSAVDTFFAAHGIAVHPTLLDEPWISWFAEIPQPIRVAADGQPDAADRDAAPADPHPSLAPPAGLQHLAVSLAGDKGDFAFQMKLDPAQYSQRMMLEVMNGNQMYEAETTQFAASVLQPGDSFLDVGVHVGYFSMLAASLVGSGGRVIAFEPNEANYQALRQNIEVNGFRHVTPVNHPVGEHEHTADLYVNADNDGGHALWDVGLHSFNRKSRETPEIRKVEVVSLDRYLADHDLGSLRLIKIDTEGSEFAVLRGARETLRRYRVPYVVAEVNRFALTRMGSSEEALRSLMSEMGYETFCFIPGQSRLVRLADDQTVQSDFVFNLLFRLPEAA
jgi:FkbM family methyltransferase